MQEPELDPGTKPLQESELNLDTLHVQKPELDLDTKPVQKSQNSELDLDSGTGNKSFQSHLFFRGDVLPYEIRYSGKDGILLRDRLL